MDDELMVKRYRRKNDEEWLEANDKRIDIESVLVNGTVLGIDRWHE